MPYTPPSPRSAATSGSHTTSPSLESQKWTYSGGHGPGSLVQTVLNARRIDENINIRQLPTSGVNKFQPKNIRGLQAVTWQTEDRLFRTTEVAVKPSQPLALAKQPKQKDITTTRNLKNMALRAFGDSSHNGLYADPSVLINMQCRNSCEAPSIGSAEDITDEHDPETLRQGQPVPKKKSGELVKSVLRSPKRSSKSTFSKAVRFHSHLEHVRPFLKSDMPLAVSTNLSPTKMYGSKTDTPFDDIVLHDGNTTSPKWEPIASNFATETPQRLSLPVRLERVFMSLEYMELIGSVAVANIAFHKDIIVRYTLDHWKITTDVVAEFSNNVCQENSSDGYDRFNFRINLADHANLEGKALLFAVQYRVNGQEYWDNNNSANFQINFKETPTQYKVKSDMREVSLVSDNEISKRKEPSSPSLPNQLQSIPAASSPSVDTTDVYKYDELKQLVNDWISGLRTLPELKGVECTGDLHSSTPIVMRPSGQPLSSRYNFDTSLAAAIHGNKSALAARKIPTTAKANADTQNAKFLSCAPKTGSPVPTATFYGTKRAVSLPSTSDVATSRVPSIGSRTYQAQPTGTEKSLIASAPHCNLPEIHCISGSAGCQPQLNDRALQPGQFNNSNERSIPAIFT